MDRELSYRDLFAYLMAENDHRRTEAEREDFAHKYSKMPPRMKRKSVAQQLARKKFAITLVDNDPAMAAEYLSFLATEFVNAKDHIRQLNKMLAKRRET